MSKTFEIGDTIRIKNIEGIVEEINLNYTKVMDINGKVVFIPNRTLNTENLENLTRRRFFVYTYKVPFKKGMGDPDKIKDSIMFIEGKIGEYAPISITITTEIPNANDFVYVFEVKVPEADEEFDKEIQEFLIPFIFPRG
jgi:small-conductance mechanosensitive channel